MRKIEYICGLPGPLGGETLKNKVIYEYLKKEKVEFNILDFERYKQNIIILLLKCIWSIINPFTKSILISKSSRSAYHYIRLVSMLNFLKKDVYYLVIGGVFHNFLKSGEFNYKKYKKLKKIYVESRKMKNELERLGLTNIEYLPNFKDFEFLEYKKRKIELPLKCLFFSRIIPEKGVNMIFEALEEINKNETKIKVDFYGPIEESYKGKFNKKNENNENTNYKGVLDVQNNETFNILSEYDLMLFPTYWKGEGFPGTLIDSFISGVPVLASDWNCNSEIITEDTGYIFEAKKQKEFGKKLKEIIENLEQLVEKRENCFKEAKKYHVKNVLKSIIKEIRE